jgi:flagellar motor switch/type III secretory pathway protein FliN
LFTEIRGPWALTNPHVMPASRSSSGTSLASRWTCTTWKSTRTDSGGPTITVNDDVYQALQERAARSGMTVQELLDVALGAAILLLSEFNEPPEEPGDMT